LSGQRLRRPYKKYHIILKRIPGTLHHEKNIYYLEMKQVPMDCGIICGNPLPWPLREDRNRMRNVGILMVTLAVSFLLLICAAGAAAPPEYPWTGKGPDGKVITKAELDQILADHKKWQTSTGSGLEAGNWLSRLRQKE
jgi:hypothetical protein